MIHINLRMSSPLGTTQWSDREGPHLKQRAVSDAQALQDVLPDFVGGSGGQSNHWNARKSISLYNKAELHAAI